MSSNIDQIYIANPITSNTSTDLMYFGQSPYSSGNDAAMTYANFSAQFGAPYTAAALTKTDDTNVTLTLGGTPATALLHAASITAGWTGTLSGTRGGTGVNNGSNTITVGGNMSTANSFTTSGNFAVTQTYTGITTVTFPTSGTLATTSQIPTPAALTKTDDTNVTLTLGGTPSTALLQATSITAGWTGTLSGTRGGTGVNNGASTITIGGSVTFSGAFTFAGTLTNTTAVTFPTSGTLATTSQLLSSPLTTKGDLWGWTTTNARIAVGTTNGQILQVSSGAAAGLAYSTPTYPSASGSAGTIIRADGTNNVYSTSTFADTYAASTLLYSNGANTVTGLATANSAALVTNGSGVPAWQALSAGQILVGTTSGAPAATAINSGTGILVANGSGSITISSTGANPWVDETGSSVTMATNTGYTSDDGASLVTFTLPTTSAIGDWVEINGKGSGGWTIAQATGQQIHFGNATTTSGASGTLSSSLQYDCVRLRCLTANTIWTIVSVQGNLTVV